MLPEPDGNPTESAPVLGPQPTHETSNRKGNNLDGSGLVRMIPYQPIAGGIRPKAVGSRTAG